MSSDPDAVASICAEVDALDWTNIQEPVRRAFTSTLEVLRKQQSTLKTLSYDLAQERQARQMLSNTVARLSEQVSASVSAVQNDVEGKLEAYQEEMQQRTAETLDRDRLRATREAMAQRTKLLEDWRVRWQQHQNAVQEQLREKATRNDLAKLPQNGELANKHDVAALHGLLQQRPTLPEVEKLLEGLVGRLDLEAMLAHKVDETTLQTSLQDRVSRRDLDKIGVELNERCTRDEIRDLIDTEIHRTLFGLGRIGPISRLKEVYDEELHTPSLPVPMGTRPEQQATQSRAPAVPESVERIPVPERNSYVSVYQPKILSRAEVEDIVDEKIGVKLARQEVREHAVADRVVSALSSQQESVSAAVDGAMASATAAMQADVSISLNELRNDLLGVETRFANELDSMRVKQRAQSNEIVEVLNKKAWKNEVKRALDSRVSIKSLRQALEKLVTKAEIERILRDKVDTIEFRATLTQSLGVLANNLQRRADNHEQRDQTDRDVEQVCRQVAQREARESAREETKTWTVQYQTTLKSLEEESRQRIVDLKEELETFSLSVRRELAVRVRRDEMNAFVGDKLGEYSESVTTIMQGYSENLQKFRKEVHANQINQMVKAFDSFKRDVATHLTAGRWLWRSGDVTEGGMLPWEAEASNSNPSLFRWHPASTAILCQAAGLYELHAAIFTTSDTRIDILINGEPALEADSGATSRKGASAVRRLPHSEGELTSASVCEFLALQEQSRVGIRLLALESVSAQGFLSLRKL